MGLLRLELENFKSYGGRQTIGPFTRFSAVIGPNGAGKSNLMDAISFVLGIKARELRGNNFKDLIHGANTGRPASERASVTAVLLSGDGDEATEVHFTRTITAKGNTDYRIDRKVVTWEVYNTKLSSFDILVKARNFLVFQGDVEAIAQRNPKQITQLFETISGSEELREEYERLKKEKTEAEEKHLFVQQKKKGFAAEKKQYKEQKEEAERFRKLQQDLATTKTEHVLWDLRHIERDVAGCIDGLKDKGKALDGLAKRRRKVEDQLKTKKQETAAQQKQIDVHEKNVAKQEKALGATEPKLMKTREELAHSRNRLATARAALEKNLQLQTEHASKLKDLQGELQAVQRAAARYEASAEGAGQGQLQLEAEQLAQYTQLKEKANQATVGPRQQLDKVMRDRTAATETRDRSQARATELRSRLAQLETDRAKHQERLSKLQRLTTEYRVELTATQAEAQQLQAELTEASTKHKELTDRIETITASLSQAKADRHENTRARKFNEALESMKRLYPGVHGRLIDLCKPVNKRYHVALAVIMGKNMDAIVVDAEKVGVDCIQFLKQERIGVASFIPLDTILTQEINEKYRHLGGTTKLVIDVIDFDASIQKAVMHACGNAVVCDSEDEAKRLCFDQGVNKAVSLDGTVIKASGAMEGGLGGVEGRAHRWEEKHVETLRQEKEQCQDQLNELRAARRKQTQLESLESKIKGFQSRLGFAEADVKLEQGKLQACSDETREVQAQLTRLDPEIAREAEEAGQFEGEITSLRQEIDKQTDKIFGAFCKTVKIPNIREYEEKMLTAAQDRARRRTDFRKQIDALRAQVEYESSRNTDEPVEKQQGLIKDLEASIAKLEATEAAQTQAVAKETATLEQLRETLKEAQSAAEDKQVEIRELKKQLSDRVREAGDVQKEVNALETQLEQLRVRRHTLFKRCKLEDIAVPLLKGSLDSIVEETAASVSGAGSGATTGVSTVEVDTLNTEVAQRLHEKEALISVDYSQLPSELDPDESAADREATEQQFQDRMRAIQAQIDNIAPNMKAVERLDDVRGRLKESADEFDQTLKVSQDIARRFEEVRQERTDRFMAAFEHISSQIDEIYKALTHTTSVVGGTAYLSLENNEEPYLEGIKYHAMPPLKRFRDMDQLSGGERTVAALALLFAIHSFQPAPFFVLDEVDAALDNANVRSVARYIDRRTGPNFQCIVISLKDIFYEKSNSLVGIFRDRERDCSRTLTVDLSKFADSDE
eukprot:m.237445 g.237445  ORF g.237445 m.237445 type:complete len:1238 (+) comp21141_c0_seq1:100-3813(+)